MIFLFPPSRPFYPSNRILGFKRKRLEFTSSIHTPLEAHTIMRGKGGKIVYSIKLKGQIILPNMGPYPLRLFKPVDIPPKKGIRYKNAGRVE